MIYLVSGIALYAALRLTAALPSQRDKMVKRMGTGAYALFAGLVTALALYLVVEGWRGMPVKIMYQPPAWGHYANYALTFLAFLLVGVAIFRGRLRQALRYPLMLAILAWGAGHLLSSGNLRNLILFDGLMLYAALQIFVARENGVRPSPEVRGGHDLLSLAAGAALFGLAAQLHGTFIGVPVFALTQ